jgi:hypothetical protein
MNTRNKRGALSEKPGKSLAFLILNDDLIKRNGGLA